MNKIQIKSRQDFWNKYFPFIITAIFLALSIILAYHHELWRDEIVSWHLGSESVSFSGFIENMRMNVGHPYSWFAILYFISHFITDNPESMKVVHLAISTASVFLLLKYAPFNKIVRVAIVFGYFFFYEYSIISRNYALGILFIVIFCILYKNKYKNIIPICIVLFLMGQANVYSFIISMALFLMLAVELIIDRKYVAKNINKAFIAVGALIIIGEIAFIYWQLGAQIVENQISGTTFSVFSGSLEENFIETIRISRGVIDTYIPIPQFQLNFWDRDRLITDFLSGYRFLYTFLLSVILIIIPVFILKRRSVFLYITGTICILIFPFLVYRGQIRHFGHLLILFIACLWISNINTSDRYLINTKGSFNNIFKNTFLAVILISSLIASPVAYWFDYRYPFSNGRYVAEYIEENFDKDNMVIVGYQDYAAETISGYLDKDFYYPNYKEFRKLVLGDVKLAAECTESIFREADAFTRKNDTVLVIKHKEPFAESEIPEKYNFEMLDTEFTNSIVHTENYYLYLFDKGRFLEKLSDMGHKIDNTNFSQYFRPMSQCEFESEGDRVRIKVYGNDPWFETTFPIEFYKKRPSILYVNIDLYIDNEFRVFFKRLDRRCVIEDSLYFKIYKGNNDIYIRIPYSEDLEGLRIDPVGTDIDCYIESMRFYSFKY